MKEPANVQRMKLRHLALIGELIESLSHDGPVTPEALEAVLPQQALRDTNELLDLVAAITDLSDPVLAVLQESSPPPVMTRHKPVSGISSGGSSGIPGLEKAQLGACLCLLRSDRRNVTPDARRTVSRLKSAVDMLVERRDLLIHVHGLTGLLTATRLEEFREWLRGFETARIDLEKEKLAQAPLDDERVREFIDGFARRFAEGLAFCRFLHERGCSLPVADLRFDTTRLLSKREFLQPADGGYANGQVSGADWAWGWDNHMMNRLAGPLLKAETGGKPSQNPEEAEDPDEEAGHEPDNPSNTPAPPDAVGFKEAVRRATAWLRNNSVPVEKGLILVGQGMEPGYHLADDERWLPAQGQPVETWRLPGQYDGYPVWLAEFKDRAVAVFDLRDLKAMKVDPGAVEHGEWCGQPEVTERLTEEDIGVLGKDNDPRHWCKVSVTFHLRPVDADVTLHGAAFPVRGREGLSPASSAKDALPDQAGGAAPADG